MKNKRTLKIKYKNVMSGKRTIQKSIRQYPLINLSGNWLEEAGFCISDYVNVSIEKNRIIITK